MLINTKDSNCESLICYRGERTYDNSFNSRLVRVFIFLDIENKIEGGQRLVREQVLNQKVELVSEIKDKFSNAASAVVVEYRGLNVKAITDLRAQLHEEGIDFKVYKNTMTRRAVEDAGYEELLDALTGPNAIAFSDDAVAPSRILSKFAK